MLEITLSAPGLNALTTALMERVLGQLYENRGQPLLLTGEGPAFSAGVNLKEVVSLDRGRLTHFLRLLDELVLTLCRWPAPTVAAVNGHAIAGGCVLASCCDLRVGPTDPKARIGLNEVAIGVRFPPVVMAMLHERLPPQSRHQILLGAALFPPAEALRLGLLDELAADPLAVGRERLATLCAHPSDPYRSTKLALWDLELDERDRFRFLGDAVEAWSDPALKERLLEHLARAKGGS